MEQFCRAARINLVIPLSLQKDALYNGAVLIDRNGKIVGDYVKTHLWDNEQSVFAFGSDYPVYQLDFGKVNVMICYDARFPEVAVAGPARCQTDCGTVGVYAAA